MSNDSLIKENYYFISNRETSGDKLAMYKARTNQSGISSCLIKGNFEIKGFPQMRKAEISVYNISTDQLVGIYNTNSKTGNYLVILVPNVKYEFVVNTYGYAPLKKIVEIPSYASTDISDEISTQKMVLSIDSTQLNLSLNTLFVEEKEPTLFLLTVYDENNETSHHVELYEAENEDQIDFERKQLSETEFGTIDELLKNEAEQESKKPEQAEKAFLKKDYQTTINIYSQLLELDPNDPIYNYRLGIAIFYTEQNKLKALPYFKKAEAGQQIPYEIYYYLGIIYHSWADFDKAQKALTTYKTKAKPNEVSEKNIDRLIENCSSGKTIIQEQFDMEIVNKTPLDVEKLIKELPLSLTSEKLNYKTDFFISPVDQKKERKVTHV